MSVLCIIPCGRSKIWDERPNAGPTQARFVYTGSFATKCREYAEKFYPTSWCILSAKYGFLFPNDIIPGPYDVSFNDKSTNPLSVSDLAIQVIERRLDRFEKIVVLGGRNYRIMIRGAFPQKEVLAPLEHCKGIGYMMGLLKKAMANDIAL